MVKRDELIEVIYDVIGQELIEKALGVDENANGVQFLGGEEVERVSLGTSLNIDFLHEAVKSGSNFCIFHHGLDTRVWKSRLPTYTQDRLKLIVRNEVTVMGLHYALDAHPDIGNNATIIGELGAKIVQPYFDEYGYTAEFKTPQDVKVLSEKCAKLFSHDVFAVYSGPKKVKTIGVCSGGARPYAQYVAEMEAKGVQLHISGEAGESSPHIMKDAKINYFAAGHYATEVFGVQELGKVLKKEYGDKLEVEFIDIPNPI